MGDSVPDHNDYDSPHEGEIEGYIVPAPPTRAVDETLGMRSPTLESAMDELRVSELSLSRTYSNSSSQYASSEGEAGSDFGGGMTDSLTLPPFNRPSPTTAGSQQMEIGGGWVSTFDHGPIDLGAPPIPIAGQVNRRVQVRAGTGAGTGAGARKGWQDRPTFFEYLYGA